MKTMTRKKPPAKTVAAKSKAKTLRNSSVHSMLWNCINPSLCQCNVRLTAILLFLFQLLKFAFEVVHHFGEQSSCFERVLHKLIFLRVGKEVALVLQNLHVLQMLLPQTVQKWQCPGTGFGVP